ncbi:hypothetical protein TNCV_5050641 [Trichonephila clavipes]|nr:hypothetical protein TNCV_5050641 [Trichonephila clavipes]
MRHSSRTDSRKLGRVIVSEEGSGSVATTIARSRTIGFLPMRHFQRIAVSRCVTSKSDLVARLCAACTLVDTLAAETCALIHFTALPSLSRNAR